MSLDHCPNCGHGFLSAARQGNSIKVPFFGDVGKMTSGQKIMMGVAVTLGLIILLVLLATIGGSVF
jgi:hypothetical protein